MKIEVRSLPLKDVIRDIASHFDLEVKEKCGETILELPEEVGKGTISGINFSNGLGVIEYDCTFNEDVEIQFSVNDIHPLKFLYCTKGKLIHKFEDDESGNVINQYQSAIVASNHHHGHILEFHHDEAPLVTSLEISRSDFIEKINCHLEDIGGKMQEVLSDIRADNKFFHSGNYSLNIAHVIQDIKEFKATPFLNNLYFEGKAYEFLTQQILQFNDEMNTDVGDKILRKSEVMKIREIAQRIEMEIETPTNVEQLANEAGIHTNKLQEGFKLLYDSTVNSYRKKKRLELARNLLVNTNLNVSEIVYRIGLSSKSYFSKIFKKEYGLTPLELKMKKTKHAKKAK